MPKSELCSVRRVRKAGELLAKLPACWYERNSCIGRGWGVDVERVFVGCLSSTCLEFDGLLARGW